jgi:hypothetical protein
MQPLQATTERFAGSPIIPEINSVFGIFGDNGRYEFHVNLNNIYKTVAEITFWNLKKGVVIQEYHVPVKWKFPVINKETLKKLLRETPHTSFQIEIKKKIIDRKTVYKLSVKSDNYDLMSEPLSLINKLCTVNILDKGVLDNFRKWMNAPGSSEERKECLRYIIKHSESPLAINNAKAILGILQDTVELPNVNPEVIFRVAQDHLTGAVHLLLKQICENKAISDARIEELRLVIEDYKKAAKSVKAPLFYEDYLSQALKVLRLISRPTETLC